MTKAQEILEENIDILNRSEIFWVMEAMQQIAEIAFDAGSNSPFKTGTREIIYLSEKQKVSKEQFINDYFKKEI